MGEIENPRLRAWMRAAPRTVLGALVLAGLGSSLIATLLPTSEGTYVSLGVASLAAAYGAWEGRDGGAFAPRARAQTVAQPTSARVVAIGFVFFVAVYATVQYGAMGVMTAALGRPASRAVTITGVNRGRRFSCTSFTVRDVPFVFDQSLCVPPELLDQAVAGRRLVVIGKASAFGLNVEQYEIGPATG